MLTYLRQERKRDLLIYTSYKRNTISSLKNTLRKILTLTMGYFLYLGEEKKTQNCSRSGPDTVLTQLWSIAQSLLALQELLEILVNRLNWVLVSHATSVERSVDRSSLVLVSQPGDRSKSCHRV